MVPELWVSARMTIPGFFYLLAIFFFAFFLFKVEDLRFLLLNASDRVLNELNGKYSYMIFFRSLMVGVPLSGIGFAFWLHLDRGVCSFLITAFLSMVIFVAFWVAFLSIRSDFENFRKTVCDTIAKDLSANKIE